ncbi:MAG TPA: hypothetical protein VHP11_05715 [Tepidisphaeraceae bacterium]|nr:hypothetical protein [Tepidisphaeraceae bacterium]
MQPTHAQALDGSAAATPSEVPSSAIRLATAHAISLFIGAFCLLNLLGDLIFPALMPTNGGSISARCRRAWRG